MNEKKLEKRYKKKVKHHVTSSKKELLKLLIETDFSLSQVVRKLDIKRHSLLFMLDFYEIDIKQLKYNLYVEKRFQFIEIVKKHFGSPALISQSLGISKAKLSYLAIKYNVIMSAYENDSFKPSVMLFREAIKETERERKVGKKWSCTRIKKRGRKPSLRIRED